MSRETKNSGVLFNLKFFVSFFVKKEKRRFILGSYCYIYPNQLLPSYFHQLTKPNKQKHWFHQWNWRFSRFFGEKRGNFLVCYFFGLRKKKVRTNSPFFQPTQTSTGRRGLVCFKLKRTKLFVALTSPVNATWWAHDSPPPNVFKKKFWETGRIRNPEVSKIFFRFRRRHQHPNP